MKAQTLEYTRSRYKETRSRELNTLSKMKQLIFLFLFIIGTSNIFAQDIHYSQFDWMPMLLNPALSGQMPQGDLQYGIIYRDQGFTVTPNSFKSFSAFADMKIHKGFRENDFVGVSALFTHDKAGTGALTTDLILLNAAYHFKIKEQHTLSLGVQGGYVRRAFGNFDAFTFEEEHNGGNFSENVEADDRQYLDLNIGINYTLQFNEISFLQSGVSVYHFNHKNPLINPNSIEKFDLKTNTFIKYRQGIGERFEVEPKFQLQLAEQSREIIVQGLVGYKLPTDKYFKLKAGVGWREGDALQFLAGIDFGRWEVGFAYDTNLSGLAAASSPVAGIEFGVKYHHTRTKKIPEILLPNYLFLEPIEPVLVWERNIEPTIDSLYFVIEELKEDLFDNKKDKPLIVPPPRDIPEPGITIRKNEVIQLENIYYNFNSKRILDDAEIDLSNILNIMTTYPTVVIELSSHTDARGDDDYNQKLSQGRAESARKWLIRKGIKPRRIVAKGYGEDKILNHCKNGVRCDDEFHRVNRRTEFKIIEGPDSVIMKSSN